MNLFARFNQVGTTVIVASHDIQLIKEMGVRILGLEQGRVVSDSDRSDQNAFSQADETAGLHGEVS